MAMMKGGRQMSLTVKGTQEQLDALLSQMEQVSDYSFSAPRAEACVSATIRTGEGEDIREELFHRLAAADMPIMELSLSEKSLEDVFLELTGEEEKEHESNI